MLLRKTFRFEASHILPRHPGKCSRLHGHSWVLHVEVQGSVNKETGFVMDYADISSYVKPVVEALDHRHLGAWDKFNLPGCRFPVGIPEVWLASRSTALPWDLYPSSENLLWMIGSMLDQLSWSKLALEETCTSYAELTREEFLATRDQS